MVKRLDCGFSRAAFGLLAAALLGCEKPRTSVSPAMPSAPPSAVIAPPMAATPRPRFAPEGIVYLTKRVSITSENSVVGIPEGTRVAVIARAGEKLTGHVEGMVFDVSVADTTTDMDRVGEILKKRAAEQAVAASRNDPLNAPELNLPPPKPPTAQERRAARLEAIKNIQKLQTNIEDAKKQLAELSGLEMEQIRKSLPTKKTPKDSFKAATPIPKPDPGVPARIAELKETIARWEQELADTKQSLGLAP